MSLERQTNDAGRMRMSVGELPDIYEAVLLSNSRGNSQRVAHLSTYCRYARDDFAKKATGHVPDIPVCRYCLVEDGVITRAYEPHRKGPGKTWWDETTHDIDVEAAMLEHAPTEGAP